MVRSLETLRSGAWLTRERMRLMAIAVLIAAGGGLVYLAATAHGLIDFKGRPLGTDFSSFYAAGSYALAGHPLAVYDPALHFAREQACSARPRLITAGCTRPISCCWPAY
ncbi:MAG: hypothetical protein P8Y53_21295 [Pseudolabrys sp.]